MTYETLSSYFRRIHGALAGRASPFAIAVRLAVIPACPERFRGWILHATTGPLLAIEGDSGETGGALYAAVKPVLDAAFDAAFVAP
jgi:hypothetical protein